MSYDPRTIVAASPKHITFIIWPNPAYQRAWKAEFVLANGETRQCSHYHQYERTAEACGRRAVKAAVAVG